MSLQGHSQLQLLRARKLWSYDDIVFPGADMRGAKNQDFQRLLYLARYDLIFLLTVIARMCIM
jgi:hypothetical protein